MQNSLTGFLRVESLIREALIHDYFDLYFQPLIASRTLELEGYEALLRLNHPHEGLISPDIFIPIAETNNDIILIGHKVVTKACDFIDALRTMRSEPFFVAINISARELLQDEFADTILEYLSSRNIPAEYLKIELTESTLMKNFEVATHQLHRLKEGGIRIALDDFGTGYSSFSHLAQLPIDTLKIDKSFILDLFEVHSHRHIVKAMTNLAHTLGMSITAEGIEGSEQFDFLVDNQIDTLQGYHLCPPLPRTEIMNHVHSGDPYFTPSGSFSYYL